MSVWEKDRNGNTLNVPVKENDHLLDAMRYYVTGCIFGQVLPPLGGEIRQDLVVF